MIFAFDKKARKKTQKTSICEQNYEILNENFTSHISKTFLRPIH